MPVGTHNRAGLYYVSQTALRAIIRLAAFCQALLGDSGHPMLGGRCARRTEGSMLLRWRLVLALAGLAVILASLAAMAYVFWPSQRQRDQFQPAPTLFAPPQSFVLREPLA
jgi:hypothetical protein